VVLPGVGHAPHLEAPEATLDAVARFLAASGSSAARR
jgi:pimeloyl-ACP methyl ester carboxylesterase